MAPTGSVEPVEDRIEKLGLLVVENRGNAAIVFGQRRCELPLVQTYQTAFRKLILRNGGEFPHGRRGEPIYSLKARQPAGPRPRFPRLRIFAENVLGAKTPKRDGKARKAVLAAEPSIPEVVVIAIKPSVDVRRESLVVTVEVDLRFGAELFLELAKDTGI